ncbi:hypothetical protein TWF506_004441 [Arthrobotrys conoides]|uniref:BTB domain-containing protein n=1 Tax=Arthrobotrys conoides TaxID=74498 RepID=A0AAN8RPJ4_9PEZI
MVTGHPECTPDKRPPHSCHGYKKQIRDLEDERNALYHQYSLLSQENKRTQSENRKNLADWREQGEENKRLRSQILRSGDDRLMVGNFAELFSSEPISILVGPSQRRFTIHADALGRESAYFNEILLAKAHINGDLLLKGDEVSTDAFEMFVEYCYFGTYFGSKFDESQSLLLHARVYALAEKIKCPALKAIALQKAMKWGSGEIANPDASSLSERIPDFLEAIRIVYTHTVDSKYGLSSCDTKPNDPGIMSGDFRLLLAHLAAINLNALRKLRNFLKLHQTLPDFNTNMLWFLRNAPERSKMTTSGSKKASTDGRDESLRVQKNDVLAFTKFFDSDTLSVFVGEEAKRFEVHIAAFQCSEFFKRLMTSDMIESRQKKAYLRSEIDTPGAFEKFVQFCYLQDYTCDKDGPDALMQHAAVYVLADRLICPALKKLAFKKAKKLCDLSRSGKPEVLLPAIPGAVELIYENTYDSYNTRLLEPQDGSSTQDEEAADGLSGSTRGGAADNGEPGRKGPQNPAEEPLVVPPKDRNRDDFRVILCHFAAFFITRLREDEEFIAVHYDVPDFATDLLFLATAGKQPEPDSEGSDHWI